MSAVRAALGKRQPPQHLQQKLQIAVHLQLLLQVLRGLQVHSNLQMQRL